VDAEVGVIVQYRNPNLGHTSIRSKKIAWGTMMDRDHNSSLPKWEIWLFSLSRAVRFQRNMVCDACNDGTLVCCVDRRALTLLSRLEDEGLGVNLESSAAMPTSYPEPKQCLHEKLIVIHIPLIICKP
jgi:hypothetical protein